MTRKKIQYKQTDPHRDREAERYQEPIPSREYILEILLAEGEPLEHKALAKTFGLKSEEQLDALKKRLNAMVRECQITQTSKGFMALTIFKEQTGKLKIEKDGFGLVLGEEEKVKLPPREIRGLFAGDKVKVRITRYDYDGQAFGGLVGVLESTNVVVLGRYYKDQNDIFVTPLGKRFTQDVQILECLVKDVHEGDIVQVSVDRARSSGNSLVGTIVHLLGDPEREGIEIDVAIAKFQLPNEWQEGVEIEAHKFGRTIPKNIKSERADLTELPLVTIDGEDAKDFDDAVYCEPRDGGWRLYVAIADVSHYVLPGSNLEKEAITRGNSVYFPGFVIPMLPEALSNGLCSLVPDQERLALVCEMLITKQGKITRSKFYPAVIRSHARLTYTLVTELIESNERLQKKHQDLLPHLQALHDVFTALEKERKIRGAIDFNSVETQIMFDENGKIASIVPRERLVAHKMIEESMLAANVCAAKLLSKHKVPTLYRVHLPPPEEKLKALRDFLKGLALTLKGADKPTPKDYSDLMKLVQKREDAHIIETVMLRSMSQAEYTTAEDGHFGLAYDAYVHFTSPIRRYPDLVVHRQIKSILNEEQIDREDWKKALTELGAHCSMTERRADEATRDAMSALKCHYMSDKVGEVFNARVTAVTSFGLFVELEDFYVEGLIHVATLGDDYFYYEPFKHRMIGEHSGKIYQLGDKLEVQVMRVDVEDKKIDLQILNTKPREGKKGSPKSAKRGRGKSHGKGKAKAKGATPSDKPKGSAGKGKSKSKKKRRK